MQKININNYEAFLLDYLEGNLNETDLQELKNFALLHPELDIDLSAEALPAFTSDNNIFENKHQLKKNEDDFILNNVSLNYIENTLSTSEKINFENELKINSGLQKEDEQFQKTKLNTDTSVIYPNKEELKKETKVIVLFNYRMVSAIAAGILLLISLSAILYYNFNSNQNQDGKVALRLKNNSFSHKKATINSVITNHTNNDASNKLIAKNNSHPVGFKKDSIKTTFINSNNKEVKNIASKNSTNKDTINPINSYTINAVANTTNSSTPLNNNYTLNAANTQTTLLAYEDDSDETSQSTAPQKNNFWKRAVKVAKQLNGLGLKAVKGDEKANSNYILAFNSVSIEKK